MLAKAATWSLKNMAPKLLKATSKAASSNGWTWASAWTNSTLAIPSAAARRRPRSSIWDDRSTPSTRPGATSRARSAVALPVPQPTSRTSSPGATSPRPRKASHVRRPAAS